jgi:HD-GYP domain-containing protein (c-di-GMP phosphodiesterase class II)
VRPVMSTASLQSLGYLPIATATLSPSSALDCDLYIQRPGCGYAELYREGCYPLEASDLDRLRSDGVDHLYIRLEAADSYRAYLCQHVLRQRELPLEVRLKALREVTRVAFQDAHAARQCDRMVHVATDFGRNLSEVIAERMPVLRELFATLEHDYGIFTHVCNVSTYCAIIGRQSGICAAHEIAELAAGALLHDIGKRQIPRYVFNKAGSLSDDEWDLVRQHPVIGFRDLKQQGTVSWRQLMMAYQHHERLDGSGYPTGVLGDEIHPWAKICAIADVFDAMSCHRPYRRALPVTKVSEYLKKYAGVRYDAALVNCWLDHVQVAD